MTDLELINKYTQRQLCADEVYTFGLTLCDNEVDRDFEAFDDETLEQLAKLFNGRTGIFDHSALAENQAARIFRTEIETVGERKNAFGMPYKRLKARAYMVRTADNESLIKEIEGGIKREVSVNCSVREKRCSICGKICCGHIPGKSYKGKLCCSILTGAVDAYEWSFVAVPAQRDAGVSKRFDSALLKTRLTGAEDSVIMKKQELLALSEELERLKEDAELGGRYRRRLKKEIAVCFAAKLPGGDGSALMKFADTLSAEELEGFAKSLAGLNGPAGASQLSKGGRKEELDCYA